MSADNDLDFRLRRGLRAAAEALPPTDLPGPDRAAGQRHSAGRPAVRRLVLAGAAAVLVVAAAVGVTTLGGDGDDTADLQVAQAPSTTDTTVPDLGPAVDPVPGSAVVVGTELVSFGPDGQPGERLSLAPLTDVQAVASDRHGGWIACGSVPVSEDAVPSIDPETFGPVTTVPPAGAPGTQTTVTHPSSEETMQAELDRREETSDQTGDDVVDVEIVPNTYLFRPGQDPEPLPVASMCIASSLGVTEVDGRQVLAYVAGGDISVHLLDLQTGTDRAVPLTVMPRPGQASVGGGRLAVFGDAGLEMWDLATSEPVAVGPVDLPVRAPDATEGMLTSDLVLSPDGTRLAALVGDISPTSEVVVVDLTSGTELFRHQVPVSLEGAEVAFDGTTVAVGNFYDSYGPVRIFDVATGTERTVEAHGVLP